MVAITGNCFLAPSAEPEKGKNKGRQVDYFIRKMCVHFLLNRKFDACLMKTFHRRASSLQLILQSI